MKILTTGPAHAIDATAIEIQCWQCGATREMYLDGTVETCPECGDLPYNESEDQSDYRIGEET